MTPQAALERQIELYRAMTGEDRLRIALELHALSCDVAREGIRRQDPHADEAEVERQLRRRLEIAAPMRTERELLVDCLGRLGGLIAPSMFAGSMASNYWGIPRSTHDLDFVLALEPADVAGFVAAFGEGFFLQRESVEKAFRPPHQFNAIDEGSALKVDFWLLKDDPFERTTFARRVQTALFDTPAWITTAEDVILHKLYWHRLTPSDRQLQDAAGVYSVQAGKLDRAYLERWAATLGVERDWNDLTAGRIGPKAT